MYEQTYTDPDAETPALPPLPSLERACGGGEDPMYRTRKDKKMKGKREDTTTSNSMRNRNQQRSEEAKCAKVRDRKTRVYREVPEDSPRSFPWCCGCQSKEEARTSRAPGTELFQRRKRRQPSLSQCSRGGGQTPLCMSVAGHPPQHAASSFS